MPCMVVPYHTCPAMIAVSIFVDILVELKNANSTIISTKTVTEKLSLPSLYMLHMINKRCIPLVLVGGCVIISSTESIGGSFSTPQSKPTRRKGNNWFAQICNPFKRMPQQKTDIFVWIERRVVFFSEGAHRYQTNTICLQFQSL